MLLVAVVMPGTEGGFDVSTQTAVVPMPMLYLNGGNRRRAVNQGAVSICFVSYRLGDERSKARKALQLYRLAM